MKPRVEDAEIRGVLGDPGHYYARQIHSAPRIYGYHVTGSVDYFGVVDVPIDFTAFCREAPTTFNTPGWFGGYGCTTDIDDQKFPGKHKKINHDDD